MKYLVTYEYENPLNPNDRRGRQTEVVYFDGDANYRPTGAYNSLADWFHDKELSARDSDGNRLKLIVLFAIRA